MQIQAGLNIPFVGLGASASHYYPAVGERLRFLFVITKSAGVANAIDALLGNITYRTTGTVTRSSEGVFRYIYKMAQRVFL